MKADTKRDQKKDERKATGTETAQPLGSILGVIDSDPAKKLPRAAKDRGGHPRGIDVRERATGSDELPQPGDFTTSSIRTGENGEAEAEEEQEEERRDQD